MLLIISILLSSYFIINLNDNFENSFGNISSLNELGGKIVISD